MLARSLHLRGGRAGHPLVELDCRLLPSEAAAETFLVGRQVSVFSGGVLVTVGVCERVGAGTLILGEITAFPRAGQRRLVRILRERVLRRLGANRGQPFDANVIATTTCDEGELDSLVERSLFERELLELLGERRRLAPLRERPGGVEAALPKRLPATFRARLAKLAWRDNFYGIDKLGPTPTEDDILERELVDAIESAPDDDAPRAVYADFCEERRRPTHEEQLRGLLRVAEKLDERGPRPIFARAPPVVADVHVANGVVDRIATSPNRLARLEQLFRVAPALRELELVADRAPEDWPHLFARRVKRLRTLRVRARPNSTSSSAPPHRKV